MRYRWVYGLVGAITVVLAVLLMTCDDDDGANGVYIVYVDTEVPAGRHVLPWRQDYESGEKVPPGEYVIRMEAGSYRNSVRFTISDANPHVVAACDTPSVSPGVLPRSYALSLDTTDYAAGDTVCIQYELPVATRVRLVIHSASRSPFGVSSHGADQ